MNQPSKEKLAAPHNILPSWNAHTLTTISVTMKKLSQLGDLYRHGTEGKTHIGIETTANRSHAVFPQRSWMVNWWGVNNHNEVKHIALKLDARSSHTIMPMNPDVQPP